MNQYVLILIMAFTVWIKMSYVAKHGPPKVDHPLVDFAV